jgi:two-component system chemotaxis response regulator CheY
MATVLIIDDAVFIRTTIKNILQKNGFDVVGEAENGAMGLKLYQELKPDLVTLDITMPVMDGIQTLKAIRDYDLSAKVIMVSALGQETMIKEAVINGAKTFIVKPFKEEQVVKILNQIIAV